MLFGESELYASHIVYKVPHNYQVLIQLTLDLQAKSDYLSARKENPEALFIYRMEFLGANPSMASELGKLIYDNLNAPENQTKYQQTDGYYTIATEKRVGKFSALKLANDLHVRYLLTYSVH